MNNLYSVCWNITSKCNQNCKYCFRKFCKDNTLEKNKKIFDNIMQLDIEKITFSGGEPLLYDSLFDLVEYIKNLKPNIKLSLTTNGTLLNDEILETVCSVFDSITLSIDSINSKKLESLGRGIEHLDNCLKILKKIDGKINVKINTVVSKINIEELKNILGLISGFKVKKWKVLRFFPVRNAENNKEDYFINDNQSNDVKNQLHQMSKETKIKIRYNDFIDFYTSYFIIYPNGTVENNLNEEIGNLIDDSIFEVLNIKKEELINQRLRKIDN